MPISFTHEDHLRSPWQNQERIERLALAARESLRPLLDALEDELVLAARNGDDQSLAVIAWLYGPASALVTDIDMTFPGAR